MFILITGKPRSGKSAYAVNHMLNNKNNYYNIYANVNGLKMEDNIKPLNFNALMTTVSKCKDIYDYQISILGDDIDKNIVDQPIVDFLLEDGFIIENPNYNTYLQLKEKRKNENPIKKFILNNLKPISREPKYKPTLIIVDEAQNHLPSKDKDTGKSAAVNPIIAWWISYHGHLYMDVLLLSQNYHKIHPSYIYDIEYFLDAVPSSKSLLGNSSPNFIYKQHISTPYNNKNLASRIKIRKRKEIFNAYESGDKVRTKSVVLPYIFFAVLALIATISVFKYVAYSLTGDNKQETKLQTKEELNIISNTAHEVHKNIVRINQPSQEKLFYIKLKCISLICKNKKYHIDLNVDDLNTTITHTHTKLLTVTKFNKSLATVSLLATDSFINLFKGATRAKNKSINFLN